MNKKKEKPVPNLQTGFKQAMNGTAGNLGGYFPSQGVCPTCGTCPTCGRRNFTPATPYWGNGFVYC